MGLLGTSTQLAAGLAVMLELLHIDGHNDEKCDGKKSPIGVMQVFLEQHAMPYQIRSVKNRTMGVLINRSAFLKAGMFLRPKKKEENGYG